MIKSMVLKDRMNQAGGYVRAVMDGVVCRAQVSGVSQAVLLFADGSQKTYMLDGSTEKQISLEGEELIGCCVVRDGSVVLASDDTARRAYERQKAKMKRATAEKEGAPQEKTAHCGELDYRDTGTQREENRFPQRRWPPHPAWCEARYANGCWQAAKEEPQDKAGSAAL